MGSIDEGRQKTSIRSEGKFTDLQQIMDVVVAGAGNGQRAARPGQNPGGLVRVRNLATVQPGFKDRDSILRFNGADAVEISVIKTSDANAVQLADDVRRWVQVSSAKLH